MSPEAPRTFESFYWDLLNHLRALWKEVLVTVEGVSLIENMKRVEALSRETHLEDLSNLLKKWEEKEVLSVARFFSLELEIINCLEVAHRTFRNQSLSARFVPDQQMKRVVFVLTAHPTESRSPQLIEIMDRITQLLVRAFSRERIPRKDELSYLLGLLWKTPASKHAKPTVLDEAWHVYSLLLRSNILRELTHPSWKGRVFVRSWVGGDKDGHPGVGAEIMMGSLRMSRELILKQMESWLQSLQHDCELLESTSAWNGRYEVFSAFFRKIERQFVHLRKMKSGDLSRVKEFLETLKELHRSFQRAVRVPHPLLERCLDVFEVFPALVVPLEFREEANEVRKAEKTKSGEIFRMFVALKKLAGDENPVEYVRGFIVSMTHAPEDLWAAFSLERKALGRVDIPIVPLFETAAALNAGADIVRSTFAHQDFREAAFSVWKKKMEVMVGYSDSSKENGVLGSRRLIQKSMFVLEKTFQEMGLDVVFFQGSGGSVARGGGSVEEQTAWWPDSAVQRFKATVQGEMIHRTFATEQILRSNIVKIASEAGRRSHGKVLWQDDPILDRFVDAVADHYRTQVASGRFLDVVARSTPYQYLDRLYIGSRPSKRKKEMTLGALRAIPWVLCWTQVRVLFPVWWGLGSAWENTSESDRGHLRNLFEKDAFFKSFVKSVGFTLEKVRLPIWKTYLEAAGEETGKGSLYHACEREYALSKQFVKGISGEENLLWFRPWLTDVIRLRNPLVDIVNLCQLRAMQLQSSRLLRETTTGIASGMLTTG